MSIAVAQSHSMVGIHLHLADYKQGSLTSRFTEFAGLFKYIYDWQQVFAKFDRDNSQTIDGTELVTALKTFGYNLRPSLYELIRQKYGP